MHSYRSQYDKLDIIMRCIPDAPIENTPLTEIHKLDTRIRPEFDQAIQMYQQGLTHSVEFVAQLNFILDMKRD